MKEILENLKLEDLELNEPELDYLLEELESELSGCGFFCGGDYNPPN